MSENGSDWYPEIRQVFQLPGSLAFSYVGAVHRTADFPGSLTSAVRDEDVRQFRLDDQDLLEWLQEAGESRTAIIDPASDRLSAERTEERLSNLRPVIQEVRTRGASVWFLSTKPLHCYPVLAGSSILADAETVRVRLLEDEIAANLAVEAGVPEADAARLATFAGGSRALLAAFVNVELGEGSGNEKKARAERLERETARCSYEELGPDLSTLLESWVFEAKMSRVHPDDIPNEAIQSALSSSGLLQRGAEEEYSILPFKNREIWIDALADWISSVISPPESWSKVAAELFALERDLRFELAKTYASAQGRGWRSASLTNVAGGILELARRDGIAAATSLDDLRGPLEWLQLSELLELCATEAASSTFLGLRADDWARVERDILNVRHRVAHMRLVRAGDLETVRKARRLLDIRRLIGS